MSRVYFPGETYGEAEYPSALAIGDSWFWYMRSNILDAVVHNKAMSRDHANIQAVGFNGAQLLDCVGAGKHADAVRHYLQQNFGKGFSEFYVSGAGNDAIKIGLALKKDCSSCKTPLSCLDPVGFEDFLGRISSALSTLIYEIRWAYRNDNSAGQLIFIHGYDYPVPDGRGFAGGQGWIKPKMDDRGVDKDIEFRKEFTKILIDRLNVEVFMQFHSPVNRVIYIDSRETLSFQSESYVKDWANEMHPTAAGFKKIVNKHWIPAFRKYGIAT